MRRSVITSLGDIVSKPPDLGGVEVIAKAHSRVPPWFYLPVMFVYGWIFWFVASCATVVAPIAMAYAALRENQFAPAVFLILISVVCLRWSAQYMLRLPAALRTYAIMEQRQRENSRLTRA